jgi:hypothetical protein
MAKLKELPKSKLDVSGKINLINSQALPRLTKILNGWAKLCKILLP